MPQFRYLLLFASMGLAPGCVPLEFIDPSIRDDGPTAVKSNPFGTLAPNGTVTQTSYTPASDEWTGRVNHVGRKLLAANPQLGIKPLFGTIGSAQPELFHQGMSMIYVTEGLVKLCKTEDELAALLSLALGRMVADREALTPPATRNPEPRPPIVVPIGNAGQVSAPEPSRVADLIRYENERKQAGKRPVPPDPHVLAGSILANAGYHQNTLEAVGPIIDAAERNYSIEKQFKSHK